MDTVQRDFYNARLDRIREANRQRAELDEKIKPELAEAAIISMAIYSANESAS